MVSAQSVTNFQSQSERGGSGDPPVSVLGQHDGRLAVGDGFHRDGPLGIVVQGVSHGGFHLRGEALRSGGIAQTEGKAVR